MVELVPRLALNQEVRVRTVASQPTNDAYAVALLLDTFESA